MRTVLKVGVIGTGHVGLITCVSLADVGHEVVGNDPDLGEDHLAQRRRDAVLRAWRRRSCSMRTSRRAASGSPRTPREAIEGCGRRIHLRRHAARASGEANLLAVEPAAARSPPPPTGPLVVAEKSTVPAGTSDRLQRTLQLERPDSPTIDRRRVQSRSSCEREAASRIPCEPDRILVGAESSERAFEVDAGACTAPLIERGAGSSRPTSTPQSWPKHACNAFLALKISYVNALARICERSGGDVESVAEVMGSDPRIGPESFLRPALGYGGYCFPKDLSGVRARSRRELGYDFPLLRGGRPHQR